MASGFGLNGQKGRCFFLWTDFQECITTTDDPRKCRERRDDYLECLHHRREFKRLNAINAERQKQLGQGVDVLKDPT